MTRNITPQLFKTRIFMASTSLPGASGLDSRSDSEDQRTSLPSVNQSTKASASGREALARAENTKPISGLLKVPTSATSAQAPSSFRKRDNSSVYIKGRLLMVTKGPQDGLGGRKSDHLSGGVHRMMFEPIQFRHPSCEVSQLA
ncbi:hypothetical protein [Enhygromyxa salina]|uniref:hypothetical protein n=1 Tax=Enhygromyxa salina TaxID=215803 RepID=UPI0011BAA284|nr:hypothetical protein [Enhygromyxa salina]